MEIILVAAASENNVLGKDNDLVWHLPDDFKRFKQMTIGHPIVMGRKTFESFPKPLPNRTHYIITRQKDYEAKDCVVVHSLEEAIDRFKNEPVVFVIGGGQIYQQAIDLGTKIELTRVHTQVEGDAFFPEIEASKWRLVTETFHPKDERHAFDFTYQTFDRI
jgi:dihydrofolate reductase